MITTPWTATATATATATVTATDGDCTVIAAKLQMRSVRALPAVLRWAWRIRRHLARTPGIAGYAAAIDLTGRALWIVSAWTSRTDLARFDRGAPHRAAKAVLRRRMRPATFAVWTWRSVDLPVTWTEVRRRIDAASAVPRP